MADWYVNLLRGNAGKFPEPLLERGYLVFPWEFERGFPDEATLQQWESNPPKETLN